jgi:hypothetical protein
MIFIKGQSREQKVLIPDCLDVLIGKDPEMQVLEGGVHLAKFTLATSESDKDDNGNLHTNT